ncbi:MAG: hypothetical protein KC766_40320 [Myxococcales bacterium]|nr:hypothetical protein [Myxococcales bacterium]
MNTPDRLATFFEELTRHGFDLGASGDPRCLPEDLQGALRSVFSDWGGGTPDTDFVLITGNTRALWRPLLDAAPSLPCEDPLDTYSERIHRAAAERWLPGARLWFAHQLRPTLPFPRLAAALGLCELGPAELAVHPTYGPWFALRGLLLVPRGNLLHRELPATGVSGTARPPSRCAGCSAPCVPAFRAALSASRDEPTQRARVTAHVDAWLAVRDACPVGREYRYDTAQLRFHYGVGVLPRLGSR